MIAAALLSCALAAGAEDKAKDDSTLIKQDITIKGRAASGPKALVPPPGPDDAILQEVVESLDVYRKEHKTQAPVVSVAETQRRLNLPFPDQPYLAFFPKSADSFDLWVFEIISAGEAVWKTSGDGTVSERLEWDGSGFSGGMAAKVGAKFSFRFTARRGKEEFLVESEPVEFKSLAYKEAMGASYLEAANDLLFRRDSALLSAEAQLYLAAMGARMRRVNPGDDPYRLILYQADPNSRLAKDRAAALAKYFSKFLLVPKAKISVDRRSILDRGDVLSCLLPAEPGERIRAD